MKENEQETEVNEAQIAVHWKEEQYYYPSSKFTGQAYLTDPAVNERFSEKNFPECFREYADLLSWDHYWHTTLDTSEAPFWKWYAGGKLNACFNCVDRHLEEHRNKAALIFVGEPEDVAPVSITYQELYHRVNEMLACARLGVVHSVVFGGFSGEACGLRAADSKSKILVTIDGYYRSGAMTDHKEKADIAVKTAKDEKHAVEKVLVWRREQGKYQSKTPMVEGRDFFVDDVLKKYSGQIVAPVPMPSESPLFLMYTSGTTGRPKGCQHGTGGYLSYVAGTTKYIQDLHPTDVYWCMADIGWITGHSYIVYGPLALAATSVLYEGVPNYPDAGRPWRVAKRLNVNIFHTSPTAIRMLRKAGPDEPAKYDYHFKHMTTVGEPIEPEVWKWYHQVVGKGEAVIVDTWWQTETGGFLCSTKPAIDPMKPGSAGPALPGIYPVIFDEEGKEVKGGSGKAGNICIRNPWPGMFQTIYGDRDRFVAQYYRKYNKNPKSTDWRDWPYFAGDGAVQAPDGYFRILGRVDDVINVAGHRLGTKELESACLTVNEVAEAAVIPVVDEVKGRVPEVYISLKPGQHNASAVSDAVTKAIEHQIGKIARPKKVHVVPDMPKTRSGKIMRRVLAAISNQMDTGDVTTLANPDVVEQIRVMVQGNRPVVTKDVPEDVKRFGEER
jgi:acetyl-CoA synthetase